MNQNTSLCAKKTLLESSALSMVDISKNPFIINDKSPKDKSSLPLITTKPLTRILIQGKLEDQQQIISKIHPESNIEAMNSERELIERRRVITEIMIKKLEDSIFELDYMN